MAASDRTRERGRVATREEALARIQLRESIVPLAAGSFGPLEAEVQALWRLARAAAQRSSAVVSDAPRAAEPRLSEVRFLDTPAAGLDAQSYRLCRRTPLVRGRSGPARELTLAYRDLDVLRAAVADVGAAPQYEGVETLTERIGPASDPSGGVSSVFSHVCALKEEGWELGSRVSDAIRVFPVLGELRVLPTLPLRAVGERPVEELRFVLGSIDFGGAASDARMLVWRDAKTAHVLAGELSFAMPLRRHGKLEPQSRLRSERFHRALLQACVARVDAGADLPALVYALAVRKEDRG